MTAREISAFDKMFDMIFTAVSDKRRESFTTAAVQVQSTSRQPQSEHHGEPEPSLSAETETHLGSRSESVTSASTQVGLPSPGEVFDLFGKLRRQSNRVRQTSATAERLDRQKEEVELCETDQQLLEWTVREVFHEDHTPEPALSSSPPPSSSSPNSEEIARYLANPTYPHLLAHVMHTFRVKYNDPHTALALFAHAKRRSIHSYVFGCTTPAYNELLETRWELDSALKGIEEALVEMRANGVRPDKITRALVERVRREVGEKFLSRKGIEADGEVWEALERVEALVASKRKSDRGGAGGSDRYTKLEAKKRHWEEEWKADEAETFKLGKDRLTLA
jgi:Mtf2 family